MGRHLRQGLLSFVLGVAGTGAGPGSTWVKRGCGEPGMSGLAPPPSASHSYLHLPIWFSCLWHQGYHPIPIPRHTVIFFISFACFAKAMNPAGPASLWAQASGVACRGAEGRLLGEASYVTCKEEKGLWCYSNSQGVPSAYSEAKIICSLNCLVEKHHKFWRVVFVLAHFLVLLWSYGFLYCSCDGFLLGCCGTSFSWQGTN